MLNLMNYTSGIWCGVYQILNSANMYVLALQKWFCPLIALSWNVLGECECYKWYIPYFLDFQLVFISVLIVLLPCRPILEGGKNPSKYVKYSPEQLEVMIGDFFERKTRNESQNKLLWLSGENACFGRRVLYREINIVVISSMSIHSLQVTTQPQLR